MKRLAAGIAVTALVIGGLTTAAQGAEAHRSQPAVQAQARPAHGFVPHRIKWGRCKDATLRQHHAQCGFLTVPLDYAKPRGAKIQLAVSRIQHTTKRYQGVMLVNPGGPGGSGLVLSVLRDFVPGRSAKTYDWIGFDPRGVGSSRPSLTCIGSYSHFDRPPYVPRTRRLMQVWLRRSHNYANACARSKAARLLDHVRSVDTVRDMESLRKALGRQRINYYGFSYGTYLGQLYATLHPQRVRRFVLDSNVDPRTVWYQANLDQDVAFDRNVNIYFGWLAKHHSVYHLGSNARAIRQRFYRELRILAQHPAGGRIGPDELTDVFTDAGYYVYDWEAIAKAYARMLHTGRAGLMAQLTRFVDPVGPGADNGYAMYLATECTDAQWPGWRKQVADDRRIHRRHPFLTWSNAWFNAPCSFWHAPSGHPIHITGHSVTAPVLLIDETLDAATPFEGSLEVRSRFPTASLIEGVNGTTHAGSLSGVSCVDNAISKYLGNGTVPPRKPGRRSDKKCPPVPRPNPTGQHPASPRSPELSPRLGPARLP